MRCRAGLVTMHALFRSEARITSTTSSLRNSVPRAVSATTARTIVLGVRFHAPYKRGYPTHSC